MPGLYLNILKTERMLQFETKNSQRAWHVIPAQKLKRTQSKANAQVERCILRIVPKYQISLALYRVSVMFHATFGRSHGSAEADAVPASRIDANSDEYLNEEKWKRLSRDY